MIEFLKKNRYGRATFLPLNSISSRGEFNQRGALNEPGAIGLASGLVTAEKEYDGLIGYLLGRVLVVDHIDHAIAIARKYRHSIRMVTLEGESLSPGGSMTGGAFKNNSNLLGRRREIEELEKKVKELADDFKTQVIGTLSHSELVAEAEEEGKTVMECFPGSEMAEEYRKLAEVIYELSKESGEGWKC